MAVKKPGRLKALPENPLDVTMGPRYVELTPDQERAFLQEQAEYEAAHRLAGDPFPLLKALNHVERSGQTLPPWLYKAFFRVIMQTMPKDVMRRADKLSWAARRYERVQDLRRRKEYTKARALDQAVIDLRAEGDQVMYRGKLRPVSRNTVEDCYNKVDRDLKRRGRESPYYFFVSKEDGKNY
jgi:hypothetical protein